MADVDALNQDVQMIKRFLDAHTNSEWRDPTKWRAGYGAGPLGSNDPKIAFRSRGDGGAGMIVDEEQTRNDRIALGLDKDPAAPENQPKDLAPEGTGSDSSEKTEAELEAERAAQQKTDEALAAERAADEHQGAAEQQQAS